MEQFECFSPKALQFLSELKAHNDRDWFAEHKGDYEDLVKDPTRLFAEDMTGALRDLTGDRHRSRIFRIHRDIRFSKDKTPYAPRIHLAFTSESDALQPVMWFFGLSPEKLALGCGVFQYDKAVLSAFRSAMAGEDGTALIALSERLRQDGFRVSDPALKRVPNEFDKDHPNGEVLRRKGFSAWIDIADPGFATEPDLIRRTKDEFARLMPVYTLLSDLT